jgi:small redox-active disulfide protein 2
MNNTPTTTHTMKKLHVLGTGCAKCDHLLEVATRASEELALDYEIEKVTDFMRFADFGVMITPALVVDGEVKVSGRVPPIEEMKTLLSGS